MKIEKSRNMSGGGSSSSQSGSKPQADLDQKKVQVQVGDRFKVPGQNTRRRLPAANLDINKSFLTCREEGTVRLDLSRSNISNIPPSVKDLTHLTELYLYSNRYLKITTK
jgi:leucine-rich repeat protein SHOC2